LKTAARLRQRNAARATMNRSVIYHTNYEAHSFNKGGDVSTATLKHAVQ